MGKEQEKLTMAHQASAVVNKNPRRTRRISRDDLTSLYRAMLRIRHFEMAVESEIMAGRMPGFCHLSIGQEAVPVGVCAALQPDDYVVSTHRGHGHALAKGCSPTRMMAELFGKQSGLSGGRGGSMHMADFEKGFLGSDGIVGAGLPLACGAALTAKLRKTSQVAVAFLGDGASDIGTFSESLNLAALWDLPVVFVVENNLYSEGMSQQRHQRIRDVAQRASGYGLPGRIADGMDVVAVLTAARIAAARARGGRGPTLLECKTYRYRGHYVGEPEGYRTKDEVELYRQRDPIRHVSEQLIAEGVEPVSLDAIEATIKQEIADAVSASIADAFPRVEDLEEFTYA